MLRGFRSSDEGLMKLAEEFSGYHLIIPDFPGYGQTAELEVDHSVKAYAEVIASLITWLGLKDIILMGHSFGALVGLVCAGDHPEAISKLVLIAPVPRPSLLSRASSIYFLIGRALPSPLKRHWLTNRTIHRPMRNFVARTHDPVIHAEVMLEGERELRELRPNINIENYLSLVSCDPTLWIQRLAMPTLVVTGDADRLTRVPDVISTYQSPRITIRVLQGLGHYSPSENPAEVAQQIQAWLDVPAAATRLIYR